MPGARSKERGKGKQGSKVLGSKVQGARAHKERVVKGGNLLRTLDGPSLVFEVR